MRLAGLITYVIAVFWCIRVIPIGKWPLSIIAFSPAVVSTISNVTADTVTAILAFALIALVLDFLFRKEIPLSHWIALGFASVLLPAAKMAYAPLLGLLIIIPFVNSSIRDRASFIKLGSFFAGGILLLFCWYIAIKGINTGAMWKPDIDPSAQLNDIIAHPLHFIKVFLFSLPFYDVLQVTSMGVQGRYSDAYYGSSGWLMIAALCIAAHFHDPSEKCIPDEIKNNLSLIFISLFAAFLISSFLVLLALYLTFTAVGSDVVEGMQSRYFIPLAPLVILPISICSQREKLPDNNDTNNIDSPSVPDSMHGMTWKTQRNKAMLAGILIYSFATYAAFVVLIFHSVF